ncbi:hypothetical protein [Demequina sp. NBRC 110052]|uniref:LppM family (lipo)protein n=1 Tax=Demequina sp. NBRC 110052 TaxID=1570341 RepID=UPI000A02447F|nr:hypothetical protein [Demequina sp. NBRC 110052]
MTRTLARLGAAAIVTLALAGCVRVDTDTQIHADDTFSQHAVIAFAPDLMGQLGDLVGDVPAGTPLDDLDPGDLYSQLTSDPDVAAAQEQYPGQIEIEPYDDGELEGIELTLTDLPLSLYEEGVADVAGGLGASGSIEHTDGSFILTVPADPSRDASAAGATAGNLALIEGAVDVSIAFTFPGLVTEATAGEIEGRTVTLGLADLLDGDEIRIVAGDSAEIYWRPILLWGGIALAAIVVVGGATLLILQDVRARRRNALPPPDASGTSRVGMLSGEADASDVASEDDPAGAPEKGTDERD